MNDTAADAARTDRPRRAPKVGGQGQWALGRPSRSTPTRRSRRTTTASTSASASRRSTPSEGFASHRRRPTCAAGSAGGASTPSASPGIDGGRTATLEPHELDDEYFMLRVRIDGGALTTEQLRVIARDLAASSPAAPPTSPTGRTSSCTGSASRTCPRSGAGSRRSACRPPRPAATPPASSSARPVAGIAADEIIDPTPAIDEITDRYIGDPRALQPAAQVQDRDHRAPAATTSCTRSTTSRSSASCTPSTAPASTSGSAAACPPTRCSPSGSAPWSRPSEAADVWAGVIAIFRDYGYRRLRTKARLKFLVADWGPEKFREVLETEYLGTPLPDGPRARRRPTGPATTSACTRRRTAASTSAPPRSSAGSPATLLHRARRPARGARLRPRLRTHPAPEAASSSTSPRTRVDAARRRPRRARACSAPASPFRRAHDGLHRHRVLQARDRRDQGHRAPPPIAELEARLADVIDAARRPADHPRQRLPQLLRPHPGRRHRPQGPARHRRDGDQVEGFQVHLGGGLASAGRDEAGFGRKVRGLKVTAERAARLRRARGAQLPRPSARPGETLRRPGPTAPTEEELLR